MTLLGGRSLGGDWHEHWDGTRFSKEPAGVRHTPPAFTSLLVSRKRLSILPLGTLHWVQMLEGTETHRAGVCIYSGSAITWHAHKVRCCMSGKPTEGHGLLSAQAKMATCTKEHSRRWKTGERGQGTPGEGSRAPPNGCCEASFRPIRRRFTSSGHGSAVFRSKHALPQTGVTCNHLSTGASRLAALEGSCWWQMPVLVWCCGVTRRCGRCAWCRGRGTGAEGRWERWLLRAGRAAVWEVRRGTLKLIYVKLIGC